MKPPDLRGLWAFALTPFDQRDQIDEAAYSAGIASLVDSTDVVCAAGTLGQGDRMTDAERLRCVELTVAGSAGRRPVMGTIVAGVGETMGADAVGATAMLAAGADAVLLLPASGDAHDIRTSLRRIGQSTGGALPVVVYQRGALRLTPDELLRMCEHDHLVGLKDAHGDLRAFRRLRQAAGSRLTWIGASEDLAPAYWLYGADAWSPATLAYCDWYAPAWSAALRAGDVAEARRLMALFAWPITDLRMSRPDIDVTVVRELAARYGRQVGALRSPAQPLTADETARMHRLADILDAEGVRLGHSGALGSPDPAVRA